MSFVLAWSREKYVEPEELVRALEETSRALLSLDVSVSIASGADDEDDDLEDRSSIVVRTSTEGDDDIELAITGAVPIRETVAFTGFGFQLVVSPVASHCEPAYLFVLHAASSLGMAPDDPLDEASVYVDEATGWIEACVDDELERLERDEISTIEVESRAGGVGPLLVDGRRDDAGPTLTIRGAGIDLRVRLGGGAATLSDAELLAVIAAVRQETLVSLVRDERALHIATSEPPPAPELAGNSAFRIWVDGVPQSPRVVGMSECLGNAVGPNVVCDLVHYLSNGQPMLRRAACTMPVDEPIDQIWLVPTWSWTPATPTDVQHVFEAITRDARARFVPPRAPRNDSGLTLERWLHEFSRITGQLTGISARMVLENDAAENRYLPATLRPRSPIGLGDVEDILAAIESLECTDRTRAPDRKILQSGLWEDDSTDMFVEALVAMLGLAEAPVPSAPAPFDAYLGTLNAAARALGKEERLYVVPSSEHTLVVMLVPGVFDALTQASLLKAHLPEGPPPQEAGLWAQVKRWWPTSNTKR